MIDVQLFGEIGLIAARRGPNGKPQAIPLGPVLAPRGSDGALAVAEVATTAAGTLALRGPMVPKRAFPPGAERTALPHFKVAADGFVDTGCAALVGPDPNSVVVSGPPPGLVSFGGYRFAVGELTGIINGLDRSGTLAVRPDALVGHRLVGTAINQEAIRMALRGIGANPLLAEAFGACPKIEPEPNSKSQESKIEPKAGPAIALELDFNTEDERRTA